MLTWQDLRPGFYRAEKPWGDLAFRVDGPDDDPNVFRGAILHRYPMGWSVYHVGRIAMGHLLDCEPMDPPR